MEMNLIGKTELWIQHLVLENANLSELAASVAHALELEVSDVLVVDAGPEHVTLDVLRQTLDVRQIAGRESVLLTALSEVKGVRVSEDTTLHSEGILQMLSLDPAMTDEVVSRAELMAGEMRTAFFKRVKVYPTGYEVLRGVIEDTNSPFLREVFQQVGYQVSVAAPLPDDTLAIANAMQSALHEGYGLLITTGGVGAEGKDQTIEATQRLDPSAATPWVIKYPPTGRHVKEGMRICVGSIGQALIVNLPGPNDEVRACATELIPALERGERDKVRLSALLVDVLRRRHLA